MHYIPEPDIAVSVKRCMKKFRDSHFLIGGYSPFGPAGFKFTIAKNSDQGAVIVSQSEFADFEWIHASLAFNDRVPSYEELKILHAAVFGKTRFSYQVFSDEESHVNIHANALHLWGRVDGKSVLPNFGFLGTI